LRDDEIKGKKGRQIQKEEENNDNVNRRKNMQSGYKGYCVFTINVTSLKPDVRQATINGSEGSQWAPNKQRPPRHNIQ
jgi:hypothetical protein